MSALSCIAKRTCPASVQPPIPWFILAVHEGTHAYLHAHTDAYTRAHTHTHILQCTSSNTQIHNYAYAILGWCAAVAGRQPGHSDC